MYWPDFSPGNILKNPDAFPLCHLALQPLHCKTNCSDMPNRVLMAFQHSNHTESSIFRIYQVLHCRAGQAKAIQDDNVPSRKPSDLATHKYEASV